MYIYSLSPSPLFHCGPGVASFPGSPEVLLWPFPMEHVCWLLLCSVVNKRVGTTTSVNSSDIANLCKSEPKSRIENRFLIEQGLKIWDRV